MGREFNITFYIEVFYLMFLCSALKISYCPLRCWFLIAIHFSLLLERAIDMQSKNIEIEKRG